MTAALLLNFTSDTPAKAQALERFRGLGWPDRTTEAWHFSYGALRTIGRTAYALTQAQTETQTHDRAVLNAKDLAPVFSGAWQITCVNGRVVAAGPPPTGVSLSHASRVDVSGFDDLVFAALAAGIANDDDGVTVTVQRGAVLTVPIHIVWITQPGETATVFAPRLTIVAEAGATATILESFVGMAGAATLSTPLMHIRLAQGAVLDHGVLQDEPLTASHISATSVTVATKAVYRSFRLSLGAAMARADVRVELTGEGAVAVVDGAYAATSGQHLDATILADHAARHGQSQQTWKAVLDGSARGVFQGRIHVRAGANGTDARQVHKALLLSSQARVDAKPELTVLADDVACAHGAATGALDQDALFYLQARGLDAQTARALLIEGFLDDVLMGIQSEPIRAAFTARVAVWLQARKGGS